MKDSEYQICNGQTKGQRTEASKQKRKSVLLELYSYTRRCLKIISRTLKTIWYI